MRDINLIPLPKSAATALHAAATGSAVVVAASVVTGVAEINYKKVMTS